MKTIFISVILVLFSSTILFASDIEGKWAGNIETDNGTFEFTLTYKVDDKKLSGTFASDMLEIKFTDGKIKGNTFEYKFEIEGYSIIHKGKVINDNEIKINSSGDFGDHEYIIKKIVE